jgi:hypothetical protein
METQEDSYLQESIAENAFFHDFLFFVREVENHPLGLTKTGNLKRAEIYFFGEHFTIDIHHRDERGLILFPIRTEDGVPHVMRIRLIAHVMKLVHPHKGKLLLSKRGKTFLQQRPLLQFGDMIHCYFLHCNWAYMYPMRHDHARTLQWGQFHLWRYFMKHKDQPIDFQLFVEGVSFYFGMKTTKEYRDHVVEQVVVKDLALYGLLHVNAVKQGWMERVISFQPTDLGLHIFDKALSDYFEETH